MSPKRLFSWKWILSTILVLAAMAGMIRLGIWQLDRLAQRRVSNARILEQLNAPELELAGPALSQDLTGMEYRKVIVKGVYDPSQEIVLRNQYWNGQFGVVLLTPVRIDGSDQAVLVERGWVPNEDYANGTLSQFGEPGQVIVNGVIRLSQAKPVFDFSKEPTLAPGQTRIEAWSSIELPLIQKQIPYSLLPVYIQESPDPATTALPYRSAPSLDLTDGPHLSYAIQWFSFTAVLGIGYPIFIRRELRRKGSK